MLLHLGHLGSSSESMTYMRQRGHPTSTMEVASSGLVEWLLLLLFPSSWFSSVETQEVVGDVGDTVADRFGDDSNLLWLTLGGDRFSFSSSFGPLPFLRLMVLFCCLCKKYLITCFDTKHLKQHKKSPIPSQNKTHKHKFYSIKLFSEVGNMHHMMIHIKDTTSFMFRV